MSKIDLSKYNIRTDLIIEDNNIDHEEKEIDGIIITKTNKDGNYITLSFSDITDKESFKNVFNFVFNSSILVLKYFSYLLL